MIKIASDFSGIGAFDFAIKRLGIDHINVFACDIDKFVKKAYFANHKPLTWYDDVYKRPIPSEPLDIYMTSPPCQSFSVAGNRNGENDDRGVLFYNSLEFIRENKPKVFIFENVKGLLSDAAGNTFTNWLDNLGGLSINGVMSVLTAKKNAVPYNIYHTVLNSKNFGVPQNRERVFIVGIRGDIDVNFNFPTGGRCTQTISDILEKNVDNKFYLSKDRLKSIINYRGGHVGRKTAFGVDFKYPDLQSSTITTGGFGYGDSCIVLGKTKSNYDSSARIYSDKGISPALTTMQGGDQEPKLLCLNNINPSGQGMNGNVFDSNGLSPTLTTNKGEGIKIIMDKSVRKFTPLECWRLQGFKDNDFYNAQNSGLSNSQLYKQAGNSITVNVLSAIIDNLMPKAVK